jgi:hypothetical protein
LSRARQSQPGGVARRLTPPSLARRAKLTAAARGEVVRNAESAAHAGAASAVLALHQVSDLAFNLGTRGAYGEDSLREYRDRP